MALRALRRPSGSVLHEQINALGLITPAGLFDATKTSMGPHSPKVPVVVGPMHERAQTHTCTHFKHEDALIFALRGRLKLVSVRSTCETIQSVLYIQEFTVHLNVQLSIIIVILNSITISNLSINLLL